jgi:hypothetical protein
LRLQRFVFEKKTNDPAHAAFLSQVMSLNGL